MDTAMYREMAELEKRHWWFVGRRRVIKDVAERFLPRGGALLDVGLGTGYNARLFTEKGYRVEGVEPAEEGVAFVRTVAPQVRIFQVAFPSPYIPGDTYDSVLLLDTLEHLKDDVAALRDVRRILTSGGRVLITVPAFQWLWTAHDERAHHFRRYTKGELVRVLREAGFTPVMVSYYNFFLFPLIVLVRLITKVIGQGKDTNDFDKTPAFLNSFLALLFGSERHVLRLASLPFGVSLIAVAGK